jgi:hypothetical protein
VKLFKCQTPGVHGTTVDCVLIIGGSQAGQFGGQSPDYGGRLRAIWADKLYEGVIRGGNRVYWLDPTSDHDSSYRVLADGRIVLDEGTEIETRWVPAD